VNLRHLVQSKGKISEKIISIEEILGVVNWLEKGE
jgi:hypothetical protein